MKVDSAARSLAFSPSGKHLVVGLGGDRDAMVKEGAVIVLSAETLEILEEVQQILGPFSTLNTNLYVGASGIDSSDMAWTIPSDTFRGTSHGDVQAP